MQIYMQCSKDNGSTSSFQKMIIQHLPRFEKLDLSQFKLNIETETMTQFFSAVISKRLFSLDLMKAKKSFLYFTHVKDPYWFTEFE